MLTLENSQMRARDPQGRQESHLKQRFDRRPPAFIPERKIRQAKKRLIATVPKLRIEPTHTNKRLNNFLIATKNTLFFPAAFSSPCFSTTVAPPPRPQFLRDPTSSALLNSGNNQAHNPVTTIAPIPPSKTAGTVPNHCAVT